MYACPNGCYETNGVRYRCPYCNVRLCIATGGQRNAHHQQGLTISREFDPWTGRDVMRYKTGDVDIRKDPI